MKIKKTQASYSKDSKSRFDKSTAQAQGNEIGALRVL